MRDKCFYLPDYFRSIFLKILFPFFFFFFSPPAPGGEENRNLLQLLHIVMDILQVSDDND